MVRAYRLFQRRFGPLDATGARLKGGRWNYPGTNMLYVSDSLALCCLEVLVHLRNPDLVPEMAYCSVDIPEELILPFPAGSPEIAEYLDMSRRFGDTFLQKGYPAQLAPTALLPIHVNYLVNPDAPAFERLEWGWPQRFAFEPRLLNPALR